MFKKITKGRAKFLFNHLNSLLNKSEEAKFSYFVTKNIKSLSKNVEKIIKEEENILKPSKERLDFEKYRIEKLKSLARRDKKGNPIIKENHYVLSDINLKKFEKETREKLSNDYKNVENEIVNKSEKLLDNSNKKIFVFLSKIKKSDLPKEIKAHDIFPIIDLIKE